MASHWAVKVSSAVISTFAILSSCILFTNAADTAQVTGTPSASQGTGTDTRFTTYIPLTETFSAPTECADAYMTTRGVMMAYGVGYGVSVDPNLVCAPGQMTTFWDQTRLNGGGVSHTVISAGPVVCPSDWSTVTSTVKDSSSTEADCCPP